MTGEHKDTGALNQRLHATLGTGREPRVACSYPFVEQENVRIDRGRNGKAEACNHAGLVGSHGQLEVLSELAEMDDVLELAVDFVEAQTEAHPVRLADVLA